MSITIEQRDSRYEQSPEEVRELYTSPATGRTMRSVFNKYALGEEQYADYATLVGDVILGFYAKSRLPSLLASEASIPAETASAIAEDLADLLAPLPDKVRDPGERLELMPEGAELGKKITQEDSKPISKDELMGSIKARRTMASDIEAAKQGDNTPTTSSSQTIPPKETGKHTQDPVPPNNEKGDVPRYAKPLTDLPRYDNDSKT